jgi:hypothetical protein
MNEAEDIGELDGVRHIYVDPEPDERGQVLAMATLESGAMLAMPCSSN